MRLFTHRESARTVSPSSSRRTKLHLQALESRLVFNVTFHHGPLLRHVDATNIYLGSDWDSTTTLQSQVNHLEEFTRFMVKSSYMSMLGHSGFGVGRGKSEPGLFDAVTLPAFATIEDHGNGSIQTHLQFLIDSSEVPQPNKNRLYQIFVEPTIVVEQDPGVTSANTFLAYHNFFAGHDASGKPFNIYYSVMPYQGSGGNLLFNAVPVTQFDAITKSASHELAEAVTDPDVSTGWRDYDSGAEIGDIASTEVCMLNGFMVQKEVNRKEQIIAPRGSNEYFLGFDHADPAAASDSNSAAGPVSLFTPADLPGGRKAVPWDEPISIPTFYPGNSDLLAPSWRLDGLSNDL